MEKLYYTDSHIREFTARVTACEKAGELWRVQLDRTAFFPGGGGQACDLGTLGGRAVRDMAEEGEQVYHLCDGPLEPGQEVTGILDWARRFDLMQQHTGEHMVSGLIHSRFGYHNMGFHVGADVMEIDFDGPIPPEDLWEIERKANEGVWANLPLRCWVPEPEALKSVTYRTKKALQWPVRIVEIPGIDSCACCGVHTAYTGEVGLIKILSCIKFHGGVRLELVCGGRAYAYMAAVFHQNRAVSQTFSAKPLETAEAARKTLQALSDEKFRCTQLQKQVFDALAQGFAGQKNVVHFEEGLDSGGVRQLAEKISSRAEGITAVFAENGETVSFCLASRTEDVSSLCRAMTGALQGRGGGKPHFQQGSLKASREEILNFFRDSSGIFPDNS